jgi:hypothetical protein
MRKHTRRLITPFALVLVAAGLLAAAASAAAPRTTSPPTVEGKFQVGETLSAGNGGWANDPVSFDYQWQRCNSAGSGCANISGAMDKTYKLTSAEVDHTVRVLVTAANPDGSATANSHPTPVISDSAAPRNTVRPTISGTTRVGETLTVSRGTWTGGVTSYGYQWQHCDELGNACTNVPGATSQSYGVRSADVNGTVRVIVTARNAAGRTSTNTDRSSLIVSGTPSATTTVVTTTAATNKAPTVAFSSLKVRSGRVYVRFRVCDDSFNRVTVIARDTMRGRLAYTRRLGVSPTPCGTFSRNWKLIPRFQSHGRFVVTLRGVDRSGKLSRLATRAIFR